MYAYVQRHRCIVEGFQVESERTATGDICCSGLQETNLPPKVNNTECMCMREAEKYEYAWPWVVGAVTARRGKISSLHLSNAYSIYNP